MRLQSRVSNQQCVSVVPHDLSMCLRVCQAAEAAELAELQAEADLPIEALLARYGALRAETNGALVAEDDDAVADQAGVAEGEGEEQGEVKDEAAAMDVDLPQAVRGRAADAATYAMDPKERH